MILFAAVAVTVALFWVGLRHASRRPVRSPAGSEARSGGSAAPLTSDDLLAFGRALDAVDDVVGAVTAERDQRQPPSGPGWLRSR